VRETADARPGTRRDYDAAPSDARTRRGPTARRCSAADRRADGRGFVAAKTGQPTTSPDGIVEAGEGADPWDQAVDVAKPGSEGTVRAFRVGRRVLFGGTAPADFGGLRFEVQSGSVQADSSAPFPMSGPPQVVGVDLKLGRWAWTGGMGRCRTSGGPTAFRCSKTGACARERRRHSRSKRGLCRVGREATNQVSGRHLRPRTPRWSNNGSMEGTRSTRWNSVEVRRCASRTSASRRTPGSACVHLKLRRAAGVTDDAPARLDST
jgi:hypothetical protein